MMINILYCMTCNEPIHPERTRLPSLLESYSTSMAESLPTPNS